MNNAATEFCRLVQTAARISQEPGRVYWPWQAGEPWSTFADGTGTAPQRVVIATDGGFDAATGRGASAFIVYVDEMPVFDWWGPTPMQNNVSSLQPELWAVAMALSAVPRGTAIEFLCDNTGAISFGREAEAARRAHPARLRRCDKERAAPVLKSALWKLMASRTANTEFGWVRAHQDEAVDFRSRANNAADARATQAMREMEAAGAVPLPVLVPVAHQQFWMVMDYDGNVMDQHPLTCIRDVRRSAIRSVWLGRPRQGAVMRVCDHALFTKVLKRTRNSAQRRFSVLALCGTLASYHRQHRRHLRASPRCPRCGEDDTNLHCFLCVQGGDEFVADQTESVLRGANVREAAARPLLASGWRLGCRVPDDAALPVPLRAALDEVAADSEQHWGCLFGALTPALSACLEHRALQCAQEMNTRACARNKVCMQHRGEVLLRRNGRRRRGLPAVEAAD